MVESREQILEIIYKSLDEINDMSQAKNSIKNNPDTILFGKGSQLDSFGLVNLIIEIESKIDEAFDKAVTLADEKAMSQMNSPFRTINSLTDYIIKLCEE